MFKDKKLLIGLLSFLIIIISLGVFFNNQKKAPPEAKILEVTDKGQVHLEKIKSHIEKLSSKEFQGRRAGTKGEGETVLYLAQELKKYQIKPWGNDDTYFQTFPLPVTDLRQAGKRTEFYIKDNNNGSRLMADNVLGLIESRNNPEEYILLSAHLDHLGVWQNELYPGANDNASGVAAVLEIARILKSQSNSLPYSVIIAFWSGEEMGLLGSKYFVNNPLVDFPKIKLGINLDSIGMGADNEFILWCEQETKEVERLIGILTQEDQITIMKEDSGEHSSDHKPLATKGIPAVTLLAKDWLVDNHTPRDTLTKINLAKVALLAQKIAELLTTSQIEEIISS